MNKKEKRPISQQAGMTYLEVIVVLGIFSVLSSVALFNYNKFQAKVDIKNLANDIALKLVEAQRNSVSGKYGSGVIPNWKPSYGVYFNTGTSTQFVYFADKNNSGGCEASIPNCPPPPYGPIGSEVLDVINITKGNTVSGLQVFGAGGSSCASPLAVTSLSALFKRPSSTPTITSTPSSQCTTISYVSINITSPQGNSASIKLYPSGRIQIN